ncbi:MAG: TonB-dependent receptor, partial [Calditrichia bacterium]
MQTIKTAAVFFFRFQKSILLPGFLLMSLLTFSALAQTTGKLTGQVVSTSGEPLIGVNVVLEGTGQGAATDQDGIYIILNVRAGTYNMRFIYVGFQTKVVEDVRVKADQTTRINITMSEQAVEGEVVTVTAERPLVEFNETSSISTMGKEDIDVLPVQDLREIVNLQAGVVDGHFRGGRIGEVQYQVDGVTVNNPYDNSSTLQLDRSVLEEVQVISGTFDAKYGQAMSGVVNAVLKSGTEDFRWGAESYLGDYYTSDTERYPRNNDFNPLQIQYYQINLSGPLFKKTTFFVNAQRQLDDGWLYGVRRFMPTDSNDFENRNFNPSGDGEVIPMRTHHEWSGQGKISTRLIENMQISYQALGNYIE